MFRFLRNLFRKKPVPFNVAADRIDKVDPAKFGELPWDEKEQCWKAAGTEVFPASRPDNPLGGYGGPCIPGDDLPDSIPRTGEPPTAILHRTGNTANMRRGPFMGDDKSLAVDDDFNFKNLVEVKNPDNTRAASITNGYDRDILLEGPMLKLFVKKGETRTVKGPIFQRVPRAIRNGEDCNPSAFDVVGVAAIDVLRDMAAERTRAILRNECVPVYHGDGRFPSIDRASVSDILSLSKFTVTELPDEKSTPVRTSDPSGTAGQDGRGKEGDAGAPPVP